ncbi:hypothetical protein M0805_001726 [Coniferiporia weirii]|nr:hypothetical protein M0805_001726 [Coniferiporia weirii]
MQSLQHTMAHRGAGATRTNTRWHPYTPPRAPGVLASGASTPNHVPLLSSASQHIPSQEHNYLITPASTVYSISPASSSFSQSPHPLSSSSRQATLRAPKPLSVQKAHPAKANYVATLVDQAVKSLTDIWRPESIPVVFATSTQVTVAKMPPNVPIQRQQIRRQSVHLPSPCSPSTRNSPLPPADQSRASIFLGEHFCNATIVAEKDLVPIKTFVHEVLRRSRTTCSVLQSALCYIEAVRTKVPELIEREKQGLGVRGEPELDERIVKEDDFAQSSPSPDNLTQDMSAFGGLQTELMSTDPSDMSSIPTVMQTDASLSSHNIPQESDFVLRRRKVPTKPLSPLPGLPSPLLCPRRTFLAALILASKFLQDRCYSNRAWAKLSGLPPREVGRCERALGDALEWRLWVGKGTSVPDETSRSIMRTKSESAISFTSPPPSLTQSHMPSPPLSDFGASPEIGRVLPALQTTRASDRSLRRAATLPEGSAFGGISQSYRRSGSQAFAFAGPPLTATAAYQSVGLSAQQTLLASEFASQTLLAPEPTPRLSYSPLSLVEPNLDTPNTFCNSSWSPAHSTTSTDSSESSSSGSSVATPPDMTGVALAQDAAYFNSQFAAAVHASDFGEMDNVNEALKCFTAAGIEPAPCYTQFFSLRGMPDSRQLSMLDGLNTERAGYA